MRSRGPGNRPRSMACFTPRGVPAASRTVVNPASSVVLAFFKASATRNEYGFWIRSSSDDGLLMRWTWQSIIPGITVCSDRSITVASRGASPPTLTIVVPSMCRLTSRLGSAPVPSMYRPARTTITIALRAYGGAARAERLHHLIPLRRALAGRDDARALRERRRARDGVGDELRHRLDERLRERAVAEAPSGHRERLAEAVEDDGALEHPFFSPYRMVLAVVEQVRVDLVREHPDVVVAREPRDLA